MVHYLFHRITYRMIVPDIQFEPLFLTTFRAAIGFDHHRLRPLRICFLYLGNTGLGAKPKFNIIG